MQRFRTLESSHRLLTENYERLITINKKLQAQTKDKDYAMDVQLEELRGGYEKTKAENIKLQDNLDTQNKLWKIWLLKFGDKAEEAVKTKDKTESIKTKDKPEDVQLKDKLEEKRADDKPKEDKRSKEDDEILLLEDDDEVDESEIIFQNFLKSQKKRGFKRTSPTEQPESINAKNYACKKCTFKAKDDRKLEEHMKNAHKPAGRNAVNTDEGKNDRIQ